VLDTLIAESRKAPAHVWKAAAQGLVAAVPPSESGTIDAPTLILWGDRDTFLPRDDQEALAGAIPGSELVTYEGVGHSVLVERTGRVAADLVAFVEAQST
jgi:rifampin ADP-ribosylating transferase